jgi:hypothetical protein
MGALRDPCRACRHSVVAMDPEDAATAKYVDDEFPYVPRDPPHKNHEQTLAEARQTCGFDVAQQVEYVARSLERVITAVPNGTHELRFLHWRIEQRCPLCRIGIAVTCYAHELTTIDDLFREMFELYDEHRCYTRNSEMRARAERESERMAERAVAIRARERAEVPIGPSLYERAERESVVLAEWALAFGM